MKTYTQICLVDKTVNDGEKALRLKRGDEYITSRPKNGTVTVFKKYWATVPSEWFGGAVCFTGKAEKESEATFQPNPPTEETRFSIREDPGPCAMIIIRQLEEKVREIRRETIAEIKEIAKELRKEDREILLERLEELE